MRRFTIARFTRSTIIASAALSLGAAGCGDDKTDPPTTDTSVTDVSPENDTTVDNDVAVGTDTTETDTVVADPCDPNPCTTAPGPKCDGNSVVTSTGPGTCAVTDGAAACTYTEASVACEGTEVCSAGACIAGGDACDYTFDTRVSYVTEIKLTDAKDCCFDLDDDSSEEVLIDNALGDLLSPTSTLGGILAGLGFDINATIAEQIASGSLVLLLETKGLDDLTTDSDVTINGFYGADADEDLTNNASGLSSFVAYESAFVEGTQSPYISFTGASVTGGVVSAGPSLFTLNIPLLGANLSLAVEGTRLESEIAEGALGADRGVTMGGTMGAKLGGYIAIQAVADAFNTYLNTSCTCVSKGVEEDPYVGVITNSSGTEARLKINIEGGADCTGEGEDTCKSIGDNLKQYGGILGSVVKPDIARDGSFKDAISIGVRVKAVSADVSGIDGCDVPVVEAQ